MSQNSNISQLDSGQIVKRTYDSDNDAVRINILNSSVPSGWDYVAQTQTSTTDAWAFKVGGSSGTLLKTITITYTDSTKAIIDHVAVV